MLLRLTRRNLMVMAAALMLGGCHYDSKLSEISDEARRLADSLIIFDNSAIDKLVPTTRSLLSDHTGSMGVWGWQTTKDGQVGCLFFNTEVTFDPILRKWTYYPPKYWSDSSTYRFYAYAPLDVTVPGTTVSIIDSTGLISISGITLNGCNVMKDQARTSTTSNFSNVDDVDWMIARGGKNIGINDRSRVDFLMQHILAKFNVVVKPAGTLASGKPRLVIDSLTIKGFRSKGDFTQLLDHKPVAGNPEDRDILDLEWKIDSTAPLFDLYATKGAAVPVGGCYVIESLMLPQTLKGNHNIVDLTFSLHYSDGHAERFVHQFDLDNDSVKVPLEKLMGSTNHTLTINIEPRAITFDATSTDWYYSQQDTIQIKTGYDDEENQDQTGD